MLCINKMKRRTTRIIQRSVSSLATVVDTAVNYKCSILMDVRLMVNMSVQVSVAEYRQNRPRPSTVCYVKQDNYNSPIIAILVTPEVVFLLLLPLLPRIHELATKLHRIIKYVSRIWMGPLIRPTGRTRIDTGPCITASTINHCSVRLIWTTG